MARSIAITSVVLALVHFVIAAPSFKDTMTVHWLHDKQTGRVAMDVSVGGNGNSFIPISRQFCGSKQDTHVIDWDGFANDPLTVTIDDSGRGDISFQGKSHSTMDCMSKWNSETVVVECKIPHTNQFKPVMPDLHYSACEMAAGGIAQLSRVHKRVVAKHRVAKRYHDRGEISI